MSERRTQQPIQVTQFDPGCNQGHVNDRGVIHRVVKQRTVKAPLPSLCNRPLKKWTYFYIDYKGKEYEVRNLTTDYAIVPGCKDKRAWCLQFDGDDEFIPDPAKTVKT